MNEYYILLQADSVLSVFHSLMDILSWKPPHKVADPLVIHRVREENGIFTIQKIQVNADLYNIRV